MMDANDSTLVRRGTIASVILLVRVSSRVGMGAGAAEYPDLHRAAAVDGL